MLLFTFSFSDRLFLRAFARSKRVWAEFIYTERPFVFIFLARQLLVCVISNETENSPFFFSLVVYHMRETRLRRLDASENGMEHFWFHVA